MTTQKGTDRGAGKARYLSPSELSIFCKQVGLILHSGVPMHDGIEALCGNYKGTAYEGALSQVNASVKEQGALHSALALARIFPPYLVQMVKIGEQTGKLDEVMVSLSRYYAREQKIKRSIKNAIIYPACLAVMMAAVILVLVVRVLPIFEEVYWSLGADVPGSASTLMAFGSNAGMAVLILAGLAILAGLLIGLLLRTSKRFEVLHFLGKLIPPVHRLNACITAGRFASNMSMMLASGFPLEESLPLIEDVMTDPKGREKIRECKVLMEKETPFPDAISAVGMFEPLHDKMIQIGHMTGQTENVMADLADIYQDQMDNDISRLIVMIEPTMVTLLSVIIGAILLAVMLPMISIMSSIM